MSHSLDRAVEEIRRRADLVALLTQAGVQFSKGSSGSSHGGKQALCPWHPDRSSPSLHIYPDHCHCFGCGKHADAFDVWALLHGGDFMDAVRGLAREYGVDLPAPTPEGQKEAERQRALAAALEAIVAQAEQHLWGSDIGKDALAYLRDRGLQDDIIHKARLGYWPAPDASKALTKFDPMLFKDCGFRREGKHGDYDSFSRCLIFPVFHRGRIASITGRRIEEKAHVKLHGVPCPPLFGLQLVAGSGQARSRIIVEGETDTLTLQQAGFPAVGLLGASANTDEAARTLSSFAQVIVMLDADGAGNKAILPLCTALGTSGYVALPKYPEGSGCKDPNDLLQHLLKTLPPDQAAEQLKAFFTPLLESPVPYIEWLLDDIAKSDEMARGKRVASEIVPYMAELNDLERASLIDLTAKKFKWLSKADLRRGATKIIEERVARAAKENAEATHQQALSWSEQLQGRLTGPDGPFIGLFYERNGADAGAVLSLWSRKRNEALQCSLASVAKAKAALAPELGDVDSWVMNQIAGVDPRQLGGIFLGALGRTVHALESKGSMTVIGQGLHVLGEDRKVVLVDGQTLLQRKGGRWERIGTPIVDNKYYLAPSHVVHWLPSDWTLDKLSTPLVYTPKQAWEMLVDALRIGWQWREAHDPEMWASMIMALPWISMYTRKPTMHVTAPSSSGKSQFLTGMLAGKAGFFGGFLPTSYYTTDASSSGIVSFLSSSSLTLLIDEMEGSQKQKDRLDEIMQIIRASSTGGAGRLRGTKDLQGRQDRVEVALVTAGIEPFGATDADRNRVLVTELQHVEGHGTPTQILRAWSADKKIDMDEWRRTVVFSVLDRIEEFAEKLDLYSGDLSFPGKGRVDDRWLQNFVPLAALLSMLDLSTDWMALMERIIEDEKMPGALRVYEDRIGSRLFDLIMNARIEMEFGGSKIHTTIADQLSQGNLALDLTGYGIRTRKQEEGLVLSINWTTALSANLFRDTEFQRKSPTALTQIAQDCSAFLDTRLERLSDVRGRVARFVAINPEGLEQQNSRMKPTNAGYGDQESRLPLN